MSFNLWLQSQTTVILEPKKIKSVTVPTFSPSFCHEVMGLVASQVTLVVKNLTASAGDVRGLGSIHGLGRSPGGGHSNHSSILA